VLAVAYKCGHGALLDAIRNFVDGLFQGIGFRVDVAARHVAVGLVVCQYLQKRERNHGGLTNGQKGALKVMAGKINACQLANLCYRFARYVHNPIGIIARKHKAPVNRHRLQASQVWLDLGRNVGRKASVVFGVTGGYGIAVKIHILPFQITHVSIP
jgi:hypothetical protein